jgi:hypothetical protein
MTVFWFVAQCGLVEVYRRLRCACCLHHHLLIVLIKKAARTYENSVNFYQTTRCNKHRRQSSSYLTPWQPQISLSYSCSWVVTQNIFMLEPPSPCRKRRGVLCIDRTNCKRVGKDNVRYYPKFYLAGLRKTTKTQSRLTGLWAEIWTRDFYCTKQVC